MSPALFSGSAGEHLQVGLEQAHLMTAAVLVAVVVGEAGDSDALGSGPPLRIGSMALRHDSRADRIRALGRFIPALPGLQAPIPS